MSTLKKRRILNKFLKSQNLDQELKFDWLLILIVAILTIFGLAFLASSLAIKESDVFISDFIRQFIFGVWIGVVVAFIFARLDYHQLFKYKNLLVLATFGSLFYIAAPIIFAELTGQDRYQVINQLEFLPVYPYYANEAVRWLSLMGQINFQPTELAKITLGIVFAERLQKAYKDGQEVEAKTLIQPFLFFIIFAGLVIIQPDLGSIILVGLIISTVMFIGKVPLRILTVVTLAMLVVAIVAGFSAEYRRNRILAVTQCEQNSRDARCYQINQVKRAVGGGGLWGRGYGNSEIKFDRQIPEISNDAIIAVIGEEMGFVFIVIFLSFYLIILFRGMKIANDAPDIGGKSLATAFSVWITAQAFLNVAGMTGLTPSKGLPLPFVSEGGTSMVIVFMAVGILLNISSQAK